MGRKQPPKVSAAILESRNIRKRILATIRFIDSVESLVLIIMSHAFALGYAFGACSGEATLVVMGLNIAHSVPSYRQFPPYRKEV